MNWLTTKPSLHVIYCLVIFFTIWYILKCFLYVKWMQVDHYSSKPNIFIFLISLFNTDTLAFYFYNIEGLRREKSYKNWIMIEFIERMIEISQYRTLLPKRDQQFIYFCCFGFVRQFKGGVIEWQFKNLSWRI